MSNKIKKTNERANEKTPKQKMKCEQQSWAKKRTQHRARVEHCALQHT